MFIKGLISVLVFLYAASCMDASYSEPSSALIEAIGRAARKGDLGLEELSGLLEEAKQEVYPNLLILPTECLVKAIASRSIASATLLIENGVELRENDDEFRMNLMNTFNDPLCSVVSSAKCEECIELTKLLLSHGVNPATCDVRGHSALSQAIFCSLGDSDVINTIKLMLPYCDSHALNMVANTEYKGQRFTPMMMAASKCFAPELILSLHAAGAQVHLLDEYKNILHSHENAFQALVSHHPGSIANFKALLSCVNPFLPVGSMTIEESIHDSLHNYNGSTCQNCGPNYSKIMAKLLDVLRQTRAEFADACIQAIMLLRSLSGGQLPQELLDLIIALYMSSLTKH